MLPIKTTFDDVTAVTNYLKQQVGWVEVEKIKKTIPPVHADNRKMEAMRYVGLVERDGANVKLSTKGREYASTGDELAKSQIVRDLLSGMVLYKQTLEWFHYNRKETPNKTDVANYWHDQHAADLQGATGSALTDAVIFFFRVADRAGLGHFVPAGRGRAESYLKVNSDALERWATGSEHEDSSDQRTIEKAGSGKHPPNDRGGKAKESSIVTVTPAVQVNIEIHIAADAKPATVEEIFKNMRKYVLSAPDDDSAT